MPTPIPASTSSRLRPITIPKHVARLRAERHANADLTRPLRDRVRDDTVESERGQQQRQRRKSPGHRQEHARPRNRFGNHIVHHADGDGSVFLHRADDRADLVHRGQRIACRADDDVEAA